MSNKFTKILCSMALCFFILCTAAPNSAFAGTDKPTVFPATPKAVSLLVNNQTVKLTAYTADGQTLYNLRDMAVALDASGKEFSLGFDPVARAVVIQRGQDYTPNGTELKPFDGLPQTAKIATTKLYVDGQRLGFSIYSINDSSYMNLWDLMLMLDTYAYYDTVKKVNIIDPTRDYTVDVDKYLSQGYFNDLNGAILGNATTGEIIYSFNPNQKVAMASTSKIMTYLIIREAIDAGTVTWEDSVSISKTTQTYSTSPVSGVVPLKAGQAVKLRELVQVAMIVSSNEACCALAEHLSGSEAAFTQLMNKRAKELGLTTAQFYNPHGLPTTSDPKSAQNSISAKDLFTLSSYVINKYPEVLKITNQTELWLDSLQFYGENTNGLLFKIPEVDGLKTGYTGKAGRCLVATMPVEVNGETQRIVTVVLGAKSSVDRVEKNRVLIHYGKQYYEKML